MNYQITTVSTENLYELAKKADEKTIDLIKRYSNTHTDILLSVASLMIFSKRICGSKIIKNTKYLEGNLDVIDFNLERNDLLDNLRHLESLNLKLNITCDVLQARGVSLTSIEGYEC